MLCIEGVPYFIVDLSAVGPCRGCGWRGLCVCPDDVIAPQPPAATTDPLARLGPAALARVPVLSAEEASRIVADCLAVLANAPRASLPTVLGRYR